MVGTILNQDNIEKGRAIIADLVARFDSNKSFYTTSKLYKEEEAKVEFINPMMEALGWDVHNKQGLGPNFKEVVFEEALAVGKETRAPDYSFRLGGQLIYYLEAKKPSVNIKDDRSPAYQARRYGWSAKIPIVILTDFEELAIYETTSKPKENERASTDRVLYYTYDEYLDKWEEIYGLFSKEAIQKELFQKFVDDNTSKTKRGTQSIDEEFLKDIEKWRLLLARNIALRNKDLSLSELNLAVQLIIDRIVFFRMAEDRGIERYQTLFKLAESENIYEQLCEVFKKADLKYNSGLFHFSFTPDYSEFVDNITLQLNIDDGVFKEIFADLYYPKSPYEFSVISPEILGNIYENFLGSVIRLTPSHQAKIEQKPEVKKAGGVFYTPQYIADYIVDKTVGKLIKGKTPNQISKLRILDPACGSGSFLLRAFQKLLDYHLDYYIGLKKPPKEVYYVGKDNVPRLTIREKKRILTNNIYGVDIDVNAVEVTKLSLLLKVLEDENKDVLEQQQKLYQEKVLPNLSYNIKCGNSLIGTDIFEQEHFEYDELLKINPFNWEHEFPLVFANGGFDAVIGNPPYLRIQGIREFLNNQIPYFKDNYFSAVKRFDLYVLFLEKGFNLLNNDGILGYICPNKFINADFGSGIRKFLLEHKALTKFISFNKQQVFENATTYTSLVFLSKTNKSFDYYEYSDDYGNTKKFLNNIDQIPCSKYDLDKLDSNVWKLLPQNIKKILDSLESDSMKLGEIFEDIFQGIVTGSDDIYFLKIIEEHEGTVKAYSTELNDYIEIEKSILKPILKGEDVSRYSEPTPQYYCIYPYLNIDGKTKIMDEKYLKINFPLAYSYLKGFKPTLVQLRKKFKTNVKYWYSCHRPRNMILFEKDKILTPEISLGCNMTFSHTSFFHNTKVYSLVIPEDVQEDKFYWLGLFNSKILWWFISNTGYVLRGGYFSFSTKYLKEFPIPILDFNDSKIIESHDAIVNIVKNQLVLHEKLNSSKVPNEISILNKQIDFNDSTINKLVYELYGLNDDEIDIIENSLKE